LVIRYLLKKGLQKRNLFAWFTLIYIELNIKRTMARLTIKYLKKKNYPIDHVITDEDMRELLLENKDGNFSYLCLLKEMYQYPNITVDDLLRGWGSVQIVDPKL